MIYLRHNYSKYNGTINEQAENSVLSVATCYSAKRWGML